MSKNKIEKGQIYNNWLVLQDPIGRHALCKCQACNHTSKNVEVGSLWKGTSKSCGCISRQLRKTTNKEKYGVDFPTQSPTIRQSIEDTNLKKYGTTNPFQNTTIQEKQKATMISKHGIDNALKDNKFRDKIDQTNINKYGSTIAARNEKVKEKAQQTCIERYGVKSYTISTQFKEDREEIMLQKYNTIHPLQNANILKKFKQTLIDTQQINVLSDGNLLSDLYNSKNINSSQACKLYKEYGEKVAVEYINNYSGRHLYSTEIRFKELLREAFSDIEKYDKQPLEFKLNRRPDFRLEKNNKVLYINTDGLFDHSEVGRIAQGKNKYHLDLQQAFVQNGQTIFQFRQDELREKSEIIKSIVLNYFGIFKKKYSARSLIVKSVENKEAKSFFINNHLMGHNQSTKSYGLYTKDTNTLVSCISIKKIKEGNIDISRFGSLLNCSVRGGFSRLLKHVEELYNPLTVTSFCDLRYSTGKSYDMLGFKPVSTTLGWKWTDKTNTFNRLQCRANMDSRKMSQKKYAEELRWHKIYDAGQIKYVKLRNK